MAKKTTKAPEDPERNELVAKIEGDLPYNRTVYVNEVRFFMQRTAESIIEAGKRLLVIKEREGRGEFMNIVENELGIPYTTAQRFMNAALKSGRFPKIAAELPKLGNLSNIYTLLEAPEEDLKELEEKGIMAGKDIDEIKTMSVKEMRELIKHLKTQTSEIVSGHVKKLSNDNKMLRDELKELRSRVPQGPDTSWAEKYLSDIEEGFVRLDNLISAFAFDPHMVGADNLKAVIEGFHGRTKKRFILFIDKWEDYTGHKVRK